MTTRSTAIDWASTRPTLREHLRSQLACTQASARDRALVDLLIEALDDDGYLQQSLDELLSLCARTSADVDADELRAALQAAAELRSARCRRARHGRVPALAADVVARGDRRASGSWRWPAG